MKLRIFLGTLLAFVGFVTFTQVNAQGLGCRWGGSGWYPGAWGGSGFGYGYRYNFGGVGGYGAFVGIGTIGCDYGYCGAIGSPYGGYVTHGGVAGPVYVPPRSIGPHGYGVGRCGFGLTSRTNSGEPPRGMYNTSSWRGYSPDVYAVSCQMGIFATGAVAQSDVDLPEVAESDDAQIATAGYTPSGR